jgi:DNA-binding CsgD family transcriptional regulator
MTQALDRPRRSVSRLCRAGLGTSELLERLAAAIKEAVAYDAICIGATDPATVTFTTAFGIGLGDKEASGFFENEYSQEDYAKYAVVASRRPPVAVLSIETGGNLVRSRRYREMLRPIGLENELRACFLDGPSCWGAAVLLRRLGEPDFSSGEVGFMASVALLVGRALRTALMLEAANLDANASSPGVVVLTTDGSVDALTGSATHWIEELGGSQSDLPIAVRAVAGRFQALRGRGVPADLTVRSASGRWVSLHASSLESGGQQQRTAVIIQPARPMEVVPVVLESRGLTARERDVALLALQGLPNKLVARELGISSFTVQDHLKHIFQKLQVPGRKEMAAQVLFGYAPASGADRPAEGY